MNDVFNPIKIHKCEIERQNFYRKVRKRGRPKKSETLKRDIKSRLFELQIRNFKTRVRNVVSSMYDRKDYWIDTSNLWNINVYIRYPEITITNSRNNTHVITDLIVRVSFRYSIVSTLDSYGKTYNPIIVRCGISGIRSTLDILEINASYLHSHLPSFNLKEHICCLNDKKIYDNEITFNDFCLGEGTLLFQLGDIINNHSKFLKAADTMKLEELFLYLNSFVKWESLEGVPFIKMSTLSSGKTAHFSSTRRNKLTREIIPKILESFTSLQLAEITIANQSTFYHKYSIDKKLLSRIINALLSEEDKYSIIGRKAYNNKSIKDMSHEVDVYNQEIKRFGIHVKIKDDILGEVEVLIKVTQNQEKMLKRIKDASKESHPALISHILNNLNNKLNLYTDEHDNE